MSVRDSGLVLVGKDVLHVLWCGTALAAAQALREWEASVGHDGARIPIYSDPPYGCNCGRVQGRLGQLEERDEPAARQAADTRLVYFIYAPHAGRIKIGVSGRPERRRRELERNSPSEERLTLLATEPGGRPRERQLHELFAAERDRGEWFAVSNRLRDYVLSLRGGATWE